jgi:hypothetical protein
MRWHDLLFAHWPVPATELRPHIPRGLELDTFEGEAWLGVVPFTMSGVRPRFTPPLPLASRFAEMNVRTYVKAEDKPGVWFFSLDATSRLAVRAARAFFHLPYFDARILVESKEGSTHYRSERTHRGAPEARFAARYRGLGDSPGGALERFLTDRYCLYAARCDGRLYRGEIDHELWPLERGDAEIESLDMTRLLRMRLPDTQPLLHFARRLEVVAWLLEPVASDRSTISPAGAPRTDRRESRAGRANTRPRA